MNKFGTQFALKRYPGDGIYTYSFFEIENGGRV